MESSGIHIVVVDDEPKIRTLLRRCFEPEGYRVSEAGDGASLLELLASARIDLITLDLTLGNEDGLELARRIRSVSSVPIIMVTGKGDTIDRVVGLEIGADDYIAKPFHLREVLARVRSVLRRSEMREAEAASRPAPASGDVYRFAGWVLDTARRELRSEEGEPCPLTGAEFELLSVFVARPNRVLSRGQLLDLLKGEGWAANDRVVDTQVARLRRKIEAGEGDAELIKTVRGAGYAFSIPVRRG